MNKVLRFLKNWTLPVSITMGALLYFAYAHARWLDFTRPYAMPVVAVVQPVLIFTMLFLTFCKVDARNLRFRRVHIWLLLFQMLSFAALGLLLYLSPEVPGRLLVEGAMLCLVCPTATAAAVVTTKLHGDSAAITAYTIWVNLFVSVAVPLVVPLVHPHEHLDFLPSFLLILRKVFPMLIFPLVAAQVVRHCFPRLCAAITSVRDLAFYIWAVTLSIAIAVSTRSLMHASCSWHEIAGLAVVSLACCVFQFALGRHLGKCYGAPISSGQALGQKNTVFAIWMGYTFLNPVTSIAGGFYSVWHNLYNTWQLDRVRRADAGKAGD